MRRDRDASPPVAGRAAPMTPSPWPAGASFRPTVPEADVPLGYRLASRGPGAFYAQLILDDLSTPGAPPRPTVLDIGCGGGLMSEVVWQHHIALRAGRFLGVEPDANAQPAPVFEQVFRGTFEQAPVDPASVDLAYAAMVIEHVPQPRAFFDQLARVLRPGGVFWAFTVDRRHYFSWASQLIDALHLKDGYLDRVRGRKGEHGARYDNYPVFYRCNSPAVLARLAGDDFTLQTWSLHRVGQLDGYVPYRLRRLSRLADRVVIRAGLPGSVLVARMVRR